MAPVLALALALAPAMAPASEDRRATMARRRRARVEAATSGLTSIPAMG